VPAKKTQADKSVIESVAIEKAAAMPTETPALVPLKRRRDPKKPVMFMRSEEVTAIRNKTAVAEVVAPVVADSSLVRPPQDILKMPSETKMPNKARTRPEPMIIKSRKHSFVGVQSSKETTEGPKSPKAKISIDALKNLLQVNASKKTDSVVMPDAKVMQDRARFRQNQRANEQVISNTSSASKRVA
jgi:hypothetical protein